MTTTANLLDSVKASELSMIFEGSGIVRQGGFIGGLKGPEMDRIVLYHDSRHKRILSTETNRDTFKPRLVVFVKTAVSLVLRLSRQAHVLFSAIEAIAVDVVNLLRWETHNQRVQKYLFPASTVLRYARHCIDRSCALMKIPLEAAYNIGILIVDECRLALRKLNLGHTNIVPNLTVMETTPPGIKNSLKGD